MRLLRLLSVMSLLSICLIWLGIQAMDNIYYKGVIIKFYSPEINKTLCLEQLNTIPDKYFEGLKAIWYTPDNSIRYKGVYLTNRYIIIDDFCESYNTLIHELAHHQEMMNGRPYQDMLKHDEVFWNYYYEVENDSKEFIRS